MKRLLIFLLILIVCTLMAFWSPWIGINLNISKLFGVQSPDDISGLQVFSLSGEIEILVDGKVAGKVDKENSPYFVDRISPGEHLVTLRRISEVKNAYWIFTKLISFERGTNVVASFNLGPEEEFSEGHIIYAVKKEDTASQTKLNLKVIQDGASVQINNTLPQDLLGKELIVPISLNQQHKIIVRKNGYENLEFVILPANQEDRDKLKDYDLNIEINLLLQPLTVE